MNAQNSKTRAQATAQGIAPEDKLIFPSRILFDSKRPSLGWADKKTNAAHARARLASLGVTIQPNGRVHIIFKKINRREWEERDKEESYAAERELSKQVKMSRERKETLKKKRIPLADENIVYDDVYHAIRGMDHISESKRNEIKRLYPLVKDVRSVNYRLARRKLRLPQDAETVLKPMIKLRDELDRIKKRGQKEPYKELALGALEEAITAVKENKETVACTKMVKEFNRLMMRFMGAIKRICEKADRRKKELECIADWDEIRAELAVEYGERLEGQLKNYVWANLRAKEMLSVCINPLREFQALISAGNINAAKQYAFPSFMSPPHPLAYFEPYSHIIGAHVHNARAKTEHGKIKEAADVLDAAIRFIENLDTFLTEEEANGTTHIIDLLETALKGTGENYPVLLEIKGMLPSLKKLIEERKLHAAAHQAELLAAMAHREKSELLKRKSGL